MDENQDVHFEGLQPAVQRITQLIEESAEGTKLPNVVAVELRYYEDPPKPHRSIRWESVRETLVFEDGCWGLHRRSLYWFSNEIEPEDEKDECLPVACPQYVHALRAILKPFAESLRIDLDQIGHLQATSVRSMLEHVADFSNTTTDGSWEVFRSGDGRAFLLSCKPSWF